MIRCNKCGFSNRDSAETCIKCRTALEKEDNKEEKTNPVQVNKKTVQVTYEDQVAWDNQGVGNHRKNFSENDPSLNRNSVRSENKSYNKEGSKGPSISDYFSDLNDSEPATGPVQKEESRFPERSRVSESEQPSDAKNAGLNSDKQQDAEALNKEAAEDNNKESEKTEASQVAASPLKNNGMPTVRRVVSDRRRSGSLVAISPDEEKELRTIELEANEVLLDREMLDASNNSISRKGHANIFYLDGNWYLENMTALKTTFVQVNQPVKLKDGDVILLGDSLFKFKQS